jgi:hypothetical protein
VNHIEIRAPIIVFREDLDTDEFSQFGLDLHFVDNEAILVEVSASPCPLVRLTREEAIKLATAIIRQFPLDALDST